jgi:hypothetical protein
VGELKKKRVQELEQQKEELEQEKRKLALVEVGQELSPAAHTKVFDKLLMHTTSTTTSISLGANPMCMFSEQKPQPESLETRLKKCLMNLSEEQKPKFITVLGEKIGVNYQ